MGRDAASTDIPNAGVSQKMTLYTSKESHYSIPKNAAFAGIGRDQVRYIKTDSTGKMDIQHLNEIILEDKEKGFKPFCRLSPF